MHEVLKQVFRYYLFTHSTSINVPGVTYAVQEKNSTRNTFATQCEDHPKQPSLVTEITKCNKKRKTKTH